MPAGATPAHVLVGARQPCSEPVVYLDSAPAERGVEELPSCRFYDSRERELRACSALRSALRLLSKVPCIEKVGREGAMPGGPVARPEAEQGPRIEKVGEEGVMPGGPVARPEAEQVPRIEKVGEEGVMPGGPTEFLEQLSPCRAGVKGSLDQSAGSQWEETPAAAPVRRKAACLRNAPMPKPQARTQVAGAASAGFKEPPGLERARQRPQRAGRAEEGATGSSRQKEGSASSCADTRCAGSSGSDQPVDQGSSGSGGAQGSSAQQTAEAAWSVGSVAHAQARPGSRAQQAAEAAWSVGSAAHAQARPGSCAQEAAQATWSVGSVAHAQGTCKPCFFQWRIRGGCTKGAECGFCHERDHEGGDDQKGATKLRYKRLVERLGLDRERAYQ